VNALFQCKPLGRIARHGFVRPAFAAIAHGPLETTLYPPSFATLGVRFRSFTDPSETAPVTPPGTFADIVPPMRRISIST
jgi:hypothetical protein